MFSRQPDVDPVIIGEAADWLVMLQCGEMTPEKKQAFTRWQTLSPVHVTVWQRAEAMLNVFAVVPARLGRETFDAATQMSRRRSLQILGVLCLSGPVIWGAARHAGVTAWTADFHTATGEQQHIDLEDGTRLVLNTATAVNVVYTQSRREIRLISGEIFITTGADRASTYRPFVVRTSQGVSRALGTRFTVRQIDRDHTRVDVFEGAVEVTPFTAGRNWVIPTGGQMVFSDHDITQTNPANKSHASWVSGMLLVQSMRMDALVAELNRYHRGWLRCDFAVGDLLVSGAFPVLDIEHSLKLLRKTMPVNIHRFTHYWINVEPV
jgi:transmembrane sensor